MRILAVSDWHQAEEVLESFRKLATASDADVIVFTGDILKWGEKATEWAQARKESRAPDRRKEGIKEEIEASSGIYRRFFDVLKECGKTSLVIPGNVDAPIRQYLGQYMRTDFPVDKITCVHQSFRPLGKDLLVAGFGGEITDEEEEEFFVLRYSRWRIEYGLRFLEMMRQRKILLFHTPPVGKLALDDGNDKGHQVINEIIARLKPQWAFCGHAHKAQGREEIGDSAIVNPGALKNGHYAVVDTDKREVSLETL